MTLSSLNLLLNVSQEVWKNSVEGTVGSIIWAGILIVTPAAFALIWISQKDPVSRSR